MANSPFSKLCFASIIPLLLNLLASCQSVGFAATTQPATQTTVQPAKNFSICLSPAPDQLLPEVYITSPAPATVHVDLLNLLNKPTDWLTEHDQWNFGDTSDPTITDPCTHQTVHLNSALQGPAAAYQYENPGTYLITLTRTFSSGQSQVTSVLVVVPPSKRTVYYIDPVGTDSNTGTDPDHALQSAAAGLKKLADHVELRFRRGGIYKIEPEFPMKHRDLLLDCFGDPKLPLPILQRTPAAGIKPENALVFSTWPGQTFDITIRHLRIDSPWTAAQTVDFYNYHAAAATFGILRGSNVTIADCEFENLLEGPHGDPNLTGFFLLRNTQVDPLGISSRTLWLEGKHVVAIGNFSSNSVNESPLRAASTGIVTGLIAFNTVAQQLDPTHNRATAKAAVTLRTMSDVMIANNRITDGEFSFDPHSNAALDQRMVVDSNAIFNSMIDIKTNVRQAIFRNNTVQRDGGPCITINPGSDDPTQWIEDLQLINNTGQGWLANGRLIQINPCNPNQLRGFVMDASKNAYVKLAGKPQ